VAGPNQAKVVLTLEDGTQYPLPGALQFSDITVNQGTGSVTVRAVFPNPQFVLLPGMFVRASIQEGVADNATLVPQIGVTHNPQGQATALVVGPDNKVASRTLQLKSTRGDQWIVQGGLADGERVIVAGVQKVQPGAVVQAVEAQAASATPAAAPAAAAAQAAPDTVVSQAK
jgi:membrane fusion protein (multidrug efflux system)